MGSSTSAPTPVGDIDALITQLQAIIADPSGCTTGLDDTTRQRLKQLTRAASVALEEPFETVQRLVYSVSFFFLLARHWAFDAEKYFSCHTCTRRLL